MAPREVGDGVRGRDTGLHHCDQLVHSEATGAFGRNGFGRTPALRQDTSVDNHCNADPVVGRDRTATSSTANATATVTPTATPTAPATATGTGPGTSDGIESKGATHSTEIAQQRVPPDVLRILTGTAAANTAATTAAMTAAMNAAMTAATIAAITAAIATATAAVVSVSRCVFLHRLQPGQVHPLHPGAELIQQPVTLHRQQSDPTKRSTRKPPTTRVCSGQQVVDVAAHDQSCRLRRRRRPCRARVEHAHPRNLFRKDVVDEAALLASAEGPHGVQTVVH